MLLKESSKSPWTARTGPTMSSLLLVGFRDLTQSLWARFLPQLVAHWQDWSWWCWWPTLLVSKQDWRAWMMNMIIAFFFPGRRKSRARGYQSVWRIFIEGEIQKWDWDLPSSDILLALLLTGKQLDSKATKPELGNGLWSIFTVFHDLKEFSCQKQDRRNSFKIDHKPNIIESSRKSILGRLIIFIALGTLSLCAW